MLVQKGEFVSYDTIVARTYISGDVIMMPVAYIIGVEPYELRKYMLKKEGEKVEENEIIATSKSFFGLFKTWCRAKVRGTIEFISDVSGMVAIREPPVPINRHAYISGKVSEVIPKMGVIIETPAAIVQGIFGIGGERHGELMVVCEPDEVLTEEYITRSCEGKVIVGGCLVTADALRKAVREGVKGVIVGGIDREDLDRFLGYEVGVAVTGHEEIGLTCIITEGFGRMRIANRTYDLLKSLEGKLASINGATQIIVPLEYESYPSIEVSKEEKSVVSGMTPGMRVRIIRRPYFGVIGRIVSLPIELQTMESESKVRVVVVELEDGKRVTVPRANVEIVEE
ncbi:MAG: hypothetical protein QXF26_05205 [Candidatus Bathyarchaeia archaeon]